MSNKLINLAYVADLPRYAMAAKAVLVSLADHMSKEGRCDPSLSRLSERLSMNEKTVRRAIEELEVGGHITVDRSNGRKSTYLVHPKARTESPRSPRTESPRSGSATADIAKPTADSASIDPGLGVQEPRTESPTNQSLTVLEPKEEQQPEKAAVVGASRVSSTSKAATRTPLPDDFAANDADRAWCKELGFEDPELHIVDFLRWARNAAARVYDWHDTFREQIKNNIGKQHRTPKYDMKALEAPYMPSEFGRMTPDEIARSEEDERERHSLLVPVANEFAGATKDNFRALADKARLNGLRAKEEA